MTRQEYREKIERCQEALGRTGEYTFATPEARDVTVNVIRLQFELARELYKLSCEENEEKEADEEMERYKERLKEQIEAYEEASRSCAAKEADYIKKLSGK